MTSSAPTKIDIKKFDVRNMKEHGINVFIGKRNSGKSFLMKDVLYHQQKRFPIGQVVSRTDSLSHFFDKFIPRMLIYKDYRSSILEKLFNRQSRALEEQWENPNTFVVFDDCLSDKSW